MLSLAFSRHPSIHFKLTTMVKTKHAKRKKRRYGGGEENRGRGRVLFSHPFNNGGMISAYPLISSRLFSPLLRPFCHVSHSATPRCGLPFFCHLSICLSFQRSLNPSLLSREGILVLAVIFFSLFHLFFFGISSLSS